ncbi:MAG: hemY [Gammaproteobacteria bacterium]|jgi:HemY protein|nr:hemY [Gammaproteobacteria bacterium]
MKRLLVTLLVFIASIWLGLQMQRDSGYVMIAYNGRTAEMSIWIALAGLLITFFATYALIKLIKKTTQVGSTLQRWKKQQRIMVARHLTKRGLLTLAEGQWQKAEKNLSRGAKYSDMPWLNYIAAAKAAQEQADLLKREHYLQEAFTAHPEAQVAISLTQAQLQLDSQQWEQALVTLANLLKQEPNNPFAYKLLKQVYIQLNDWDSLLALLPILRKSQALPIFELDELETKAYYYKLQQAKLLTLAKAQSIWQTIPRYLRKNPSLIQSYSELLIGFKQMDEAVELLQNSLKKQWDNNLIRLYGLAPSSTVGKQLSVAENWLPGQAKNPELLRCLGRLSIYNQLWGKARDYLEASLAAQPNPETYVELAKLLEKLGQPQEAMRYYREGLLQVTYQETEYLSNPG